MGIKKSAANIIVLLFLCSFLFKGYVAPKPPASPPPAPTPITPPPPTPATSGHNLWIRVLTEVPYSKDASPTTNAGFDLPFIASGLGSSFTKFVSKNYGDGLNDAIVFAYAHQYVKFEASLKDRDGTTDIANNLVSGISFSYKVDGGSTETVSGTLVGASYIYTLLVPVDATSDIEVWAEVTFTNSSTKALDNNGNGNYWIWVLRPTEAVLTWGETGSLPLPSLVVTGTVTDDDRTLKVCFKAYRFWRRDGCVPSGGPGTPLTAKGTINFLDTNSATVLQATLVTDSNLNDCLRIPLFSGLGLTSWTAVFDGCSASGTPTVHDPTSGTFSGSIA